MRIAPSLDVKREKLARVQDRARARGSSLGEACRELGMHPSTYSRWARDVKLAAALPDPNGAPPEVVREVEQLRGRVAQLESLLSALITGRLTAEDAVKRYLRFD